MEIRAVDEFNDAGHLIYSDNLIGAYVRGRTREEAILKFPAEAARYLKWAELPDAEGFDVRIVQEKRSELMVNDADSDVLFTLERPPLTLEEYRALKALCLKSAGDFLRLYNSAPDKAGTSLSPRKTFYGDAPITASAMYEHTMNVNDYYFGEIGVDAPNGPDILACRERGFALLEDRPDYLENAVHNGSYGEDWTLRKVCRRFIWHDRIHARAMYRMAVKLCGEQAVADPFFFGEEFA